MSNKKYIYTHIVNSRDSWISIANKYTEKVTPDGDRYIVRRRKGDAPLNVNTLAKLNGVEDLNTASLRPKDVIRLTDYIMPVVKTTNRLMPNDLDYNSLSRKDRRFINDAVDKFEKTGSAGYVPENLQKYVTASINSRQLSNTVQTTAYLMDPRRGDAKMNVHEAANVANQGNTDSRILYSNKKYDPRQYYLPFDQKTVEENAFRYSTANGKTRNDIATYGQLLIGGVTNGPAEVTAYWVPRIGETLKNTYNRITGKDDTKLSAKEWLDPTRPVVIVPDDEKKNMDWNFGLSLLGGTLGGAFNRGGITESSNLAQSNNKVYTPIKSAVNDFRNAQFAGAIEDFIPYGAKIIKSTVDSNGYPTIKYKLTGSPYSVDNYHFGQGFSGNIKLQGQYIKPTEINTVSVPSATPLVRGYDKAFPSAFVVPETKLNLPSINDNVHISRYDEWNPWQGTIPQIDSGYVSYNRGPVSNSSIGLVRTAPERHTNPYATDYLHSQPYIQAITVPAKGVDTQESYNNGAIIPTAEQVKHPYGYSTFGL